MIELIDDRAMELPPLNQFLAHRLIERSACRETLGEWRRLPAVNLEALGRCCCGFRKWCCELPQLREMDINPFIVDERGAVAVDARIVIDHAPQTSGVAANHYGHLAILPYPARFEQIWLLPGGGNTPSAPSAPTMRRCCRTWYWGSPESRYFRFVSSISELPLSMLARFTLIDYDREMAWWRCTASARPGPTDSSPKANASWGIALRYQSGSVQL